MSVECIPLGDDDQVPGDDILPKPAEEGDGYAQSSCSSPPRLSTLGFPVQVSEEEAATTNMRVLNCENYEDKKLFFIPKEQPVDLLFFRMIFARLRDQNGLLKNSADLDANIPVGAFHRAFERLFFVLGDDSGFDSWNFVQNSAGYVGWAEFCYVFQRKSVIFTLSWFERIFLTFDDPETCFLANFISSLVLVTIFVSSLCFILSTVPEFQVYPSDGSMPKAAEAFGTIEDVCLWLFTVEYVIRLGTCWAVRTEYFDKVKLLEIICGYEAIPVVSAPWRVLKFMREPSNLVDLAAILPGIFGKVFTSSTGGGFVVLRLIRLTRILRAFKSPKLRTPVTVIARTVTQSTKALYVLAFNLLLGIVISGSLIYLAEGGEWDPATRSFRRSISRSYNSTSDSWDDVMAESPFVSIPHSFWWAVVTATTVGYGDQVPVSSAGYAVAVITILFSLVMLALPVGIIGGNFSQVWHDHEEERRMEVKALERERGYMAAAVLANNPLALSCMMLVSIWNERLPEEGSLRPGRSQSWEDIPLMTDAAEFMGEALVQLELNPDKSVFRKMRLPLKRRAEIPRRRITGSIYLQYEWEPQPREHHPYEWMPSKNSKATQATMFSTFAARHEAPKGQLKVVLLSAEGLLNLNWSSQSSASNPYAMVLCYPSHPPAGEGLQPVGWRMPTALNTCNPTWNASHCFTYSWSTVPYTLSQGLCRSMSPRRDASEGGSEALARSAATANARLERALALLNDLATDMRQVKDEVRSLSTRVDKLAPVPVQMPLTVLPPGWLTETRDPSTEAWA
mmetsp:Transcript_59943/g.130011  ORF Transcript_59943/g.130011 Transcript_59943/m.130011 type:complete len:793 (+) Transcript_59943:71-2449(+)